MISRGSMPFPTCLYPETRNLQNSCQVCLLFYRFVVNLAFSSRGLFSSVYLPMCVLIYWGMISPIPSPLLSRLTKSIKAEFPHHLFTPSPAPQTSSTRSTLLNLQLAAPPFSYPSCCQPPGQLFSVSFSLLLSSFLGYTGQEVQSSMFLVGKLVLWQEDVRSLPAGPSTPSPLVYLQDSLSSRRFLIDSRASVSVFPAPPSNSRSGVSLLTADGSSLSCSVLA